MKKLSLITAMMLALSLSLVFLSGCGQKEGGSAKIRVATKPSSEGAIIQYAYEKGYFEEEGLDVEIALFATGAPINEAMAAGEADMAASGNASIFSLATGEYTLLAEMVSAAGGMGLFVRPDSEILDVKGELPDSPDIYGNAETVKGKTILAALGTSAQLNAQKYAARFGLAKEDITIVHMDFGPAYQAFLNGEGDIIASIPPYSFDLLNEGMVEIASYLDATGFDACDALFVSNSFLEANRENCVKFVRAMVKAQTDMQDDALRAEFSMKFFNDNGKSYDDATMAQEIEVRRYLDKESYLADSYVFGKSFFEQGDFFVESGNIEPDMVGNVKAACDPSVLNDALGIDLPKP